MTNTCKALLVAVGLAVFAAPPLFSQSPAADPGVTMIFASDTQLTWWRGGNDPDCKDCADTKGPLTNAHMVSAMNELASLKSWPSTVKAAPLVQPSGLIINGDLTAFWKPEEIAMYLGFYESSSFHFPVFPGLGNHDYKNNTDKTCFYGFSLDRYRCAKEAIWWMARKTFSLPNVVNRDVPDYIAVLNKGAYVTRFTVTYTSNSTGQRVSKSTDAYEVGQRRGIPLTTDTGFPIDVKLEYHTGWFWTTLDEIKNVGSGVHCYSVTGIVGDADWQHDSCAPSWPSGSSGSLSYSFDIGNLHFVQLNFHPAYTINVQKGETVGQIPDYDIDESPSFNVTAAYDWLRADLFLADARKQHIVLNMHAVEDAYDVFADAQLLDAMRGRDVIAIFGGHNHEDYGVLSDSEKTSLRTVNNGVREIPVFRSGSAECERFLLVDFHNRYFNVAAVSAADGVPAWVTSKDDICDPRGYFGETNYAVNADDPRPRTFLINHPPSFLAGGHQTTAPPNVEGKALGFSARAVDPDGDFLDYHWTYGDGATGLGQNVNHVYADNGTYTVTVTADDRSGGRRTDSFSVTIDNVAPTVTAKQVFPSEEDTAIVSGTITDPGSQDTFTVRVTWGDNDQSFHTFGPGSQPFSISHVYLDHAAPGPKTYPVTLTVTDKDRATTVASLAVTVLKSVPPTVIAPPPIAVEPTEPGGARLSNSPALQAFFTRAYVIPGSDPHPVALPIGWEFDDGGFDLKPDSLFPIGTSRVLFLYQDHHGLRAGAFTTITVGPRPHLVVEPSVVTDASGTWIDLRVTNDGGAAAKNVTIRMLTFRALDAAGLVTLLAPLPPVSIDNLGPGAATNVRARIFISPGVTRFAVNTYAMVTGLAGDVTAVYDVTSASR